jgi:arginase family enzyme
MPCPVSRKTKPESRGRYPGMVAVHLDSHTDSYSYGYDPNDKYNAATQFTHAAEEQCIVASLSYHIGIRGTTYIRGVFEQTKSLGYNIITMRELFADVLAELHEKLERRPVYLCFDMDVFDPSCAPGVATPSWGGLSARKGLEFLRGLSGLNIIAVDVNKVSPTARCAEHDRVPCGPDHLREPGVALPKSQLR